MLTIFNRKELITTMDMQRQANIRSVLSANGIAYTVRTENLQGSETDSVTSLNHRTIKGIPRDRAECLFFCFTAQSPFSARKRTSYPPFQARAA